MIFTYNGNLKIATKDNNEFGTEFLVLLGKYIENNKLGYHNVYRNTISLDKFDMKDFYEFTIATGVKEYSVIMGEK